MKTAIVTGATGCIGNAVVQSLLDDPRDKWKIHIIARPTSSLERAKNILPFVSVGWPDEGVNVDAIFHCAGNTSHHPDETDLIYRDNQYFTDYMVVQSILRNAGCFIFTSTAAVYMYPNPEEVRRVVNPYAHSKSMAEKTVEMLPSYVILQPCAVLGERDWRNYSTLFDLAEKNKIIGAFPGSIEFGYVKDIARAHVDAYWSGKRNTKYILGGVHASWLEFFTAIYRVVGNLGAIKVIPKWKLKLYCLWLRIKHLFGGEKPIVSSSLVELLAMESRVPENERHRSRIDLDYRVTLTLDQMVQASFLWRKDNKS